MPDLDDGGDDKGRRNVNLRWRHLLGPGKAREVFGGKGEKGKKGGKQFARRLSMNGFFKENRTFVLEIANEKYKLEMLILRDMRDLIAAIYG